MHELLEREPHRIFRIGDTEITLLGTAHVSPASARAVKALLETRSFDAVAIELCDSRQRAMLDPDALGRLDLFSVIRSGQVPMVAASLALGAYQQRIAEQYGIEPGAEMRAAIAAALDQGLPLVLIDREIGLTLRRTYQAVPWWRRMELVGGLFSTVLSREQIAEADIERLKQGDMLEATFSEFAEQSQSLYGPLIDERDRYMAARLREEITRDGHANLLVVLGAGHLKGVARYLGEPPGDPAAEIAELDRLPAPRRWPKVVPWVVVGLILAGFGYGFSQSHDLGWGLVLDWVLINGTLCALGAAIAAAHPLTVVTAFLAAPLTSLNPTIGAGMVTGAVELALRKPQVGDFGRLRRDTAELKGWWRNRVSRTLLVFLLSTLGSAIGTYVAGFRIAGRLLA